MTVDVLVTHNEGFTWLPLHRGSSWKEFLVWFVCPFLLTEKSKNERKTIFCICHNLQFWTFAEFVD